MKKKEQTLFVKLTRKDGVPVWINKGYVVTVEPSRTGGSVVVPIGDGLDYDVRESPDEVVALVSGTPVPETVPVPPPAALRSAAKTRRKSGSAAAAAEEASPAPSQGPSGDGAAESAADAAEPVEDVLAAAVAAQKFEFPDEYLERLRKLAPRTVKRFDNTLRSQFKITDPEPVKMYLVDRRVISVNGTHVVWLTPDPSETPENVSDMVLG